MHELRLFQMRLSALSPATRRAAEAAAHKAGKPLGLWLTEILQVAAAQEIPAQPQPAETSAALQADMPAATDDADSLMQSLAAKLDRPDFSPLDEGRAYLQLLTQYQVQPATLTAKLARDRAHIVQALRLLGLPERVRRYIDSGQLNADQAYALLVAPDPEAVAKQWVQDAPAQAE